MELAYAFLAEAADVHSTTKFCVYGGGIEVVSCPVFPAVTRLSLVAKIRLLPGEYNVPRVAQVQYIRPNNETIGAANVLDPNYENLPPDRSIYHLVIVNFNPLVIHEEGIHRFTVGVDGGVLGEVSFHAEPVHSQIADQPKESRMPPMRADTIVHHVKANKGRCRRAHRPSCARWKPLLCHGS